MAGKQQYTSSLFVQSGSRAKFESGLEVTESIIVAGTISASGYFDLDGNEITGGGAVEEFFAGSGSGVSASNPSSIDTFVQLTPGAINTSELASSIFIHTKSSKIYCMGWELIFLRIISTTVFRMGICAVFYINIIVGSCFKS